MSRYSGKFATVNPQDPRAFAICDRCGFLYNLRDLAWQYDYAGLGLWNKRILVCTTGNRCYDKPAAFLQTVILPPDPLPVMNARTPDYDFEEQTVIITQFAPGLGINAAEPPWGAGPAMIMCDQTGEVPLLIQYLTQSQPGPELPG